MAIDPGRVVGGDWGAAAGVAEPGWLVLHASWARVEPERGAYDDAELAACRRALADSRRRGVEPVVVAHAGALPDWQIARGGWTDPDVLAMWGCYVDRLGSALGDALRYWIALDAPLAEAAWYEQDARRVARVLIDAQAVAYLHLRRGPGHGGTPAHVGLFERWGGGAPILGDRLGPDALVRVLATGKLALPFAPFGEIPNGTPALDFVGVTWEGAEAGLEAALVRLGAWRLPLVVRGGTDAAVARAEARGVRVLARLG